MKDGTRSFRCRHETRPSTRFTPRVTPRVSAAKAVSRRIADAKVSNIAPADVVRLLLRPVFDVDSRCRACEARCLVCRSFAAAAEGPN